MSTVTDTYAVLEVCPHVKLWATPEMAPQHFMATCPECGMVEWKGWNTPLRLADATFGRDLLR